jgi:signal transduction histidine kinase
MDFNGLTLRRPKQRLPDMLPDMTLYVRHRHRILGLMLLLLHLALWWDFAGPLSRSFMMAHLAVFLVWQPVWRRKRPLAWLSLIVAGASVIVLTVFLNYWLMTFWLLLLIGLVSSAFPASRSERYAQLASLVFLVAELLVACVPVMFDVRDPASDVYQAIGYALLAVPIAVALVPASDIVERRGDAVDLLPGLTVPMLAAILALGSLIGTYAKGVPYTTALFATLFAIALFLLAINWLWTPLAGFSGFGQIWERYLLNIGTPFEHWLSRLAQTSARSASPEQFLTSALQQFRELAWVSGVKWSYHGQDGMLGTSTAHGFRMHIDGLNIEVFGRWAIGTTLLLHGKLLLQLIRHFHHAKERERELAQNTHLKAIYETGARVTHDIKNLLQTLHTMATAVQQGQGDRDAEVTQLISRQLPHLRQRLSLALDKLQAPENVVETRFSLAEWWENLKLRNQDDSIVFEEDISSDPGIPGDLFDSVVENLLENARLKRLSEPSITIGVSLRATGTGIELHVTDDGSAVPPDVIADLFTGPVTSRHGLGIGLFQAHRQAEQVGYKLVLKDPTAGHVCFALEQIERDHPLRRRTDRLWPDVSLDHAAD